MWIFNFNHNIYKKSIKKFKIYEKINHLFSSEKFSRLKQNIQKRYKYKMIWEFL